MTVNAGYGAHNQFTAQPGGGENLVAILLTAAEGLRSNDACLLYLVSRSPEDPDIVWVTEVWTDKAAHDASLSDEGTREAIGRAMPLIAGIRGTELRPVGGKGLQS